MNQGFARIGFVSTRFAGTDGVTFEAGKWARIFTEQGAACFWFAGQLEKPASISYLAPEAFFNHPENLEIQTGLFGTTQRSPSITQRVDAMADRLRKELLNFIQRFDLDLLVVENALAIPMHIPLGLAITTVIAETNISVMAHHHDFAWERERFSVNAAADYLDVAFPPRLPGVAHVVINSMQKAALMERFQLEATVIPNVLDFDAPPIVSDNYAQNFRSDIGIPKEATLVLQPTRIVARKGIEHSIELVRQLADRNAMLVLSHPAGDEGVDYLHAIEARIADAKIPAIFLSGRIGQKRGFTSDGKKIYTLADLYPQADLVTYPSLWEGFGNALLEAIYFGRPILLNAYPVYRSDIAPHGLRVVEMDGTITGDVVEQVRRLLDDQSLRSQWAQENFEIGRRHFSIAIAKERLSEISIKLS